jgi:acyl-[acyl-carrier-protein] desaturase
VTKPTDLGSDRSDVVLDHRDVIRAIEPAVGDHLHLLLPLGKAWQPTDYLPDLEADSWRDQIEGFRQAAATISDELLVVLVGDMLTEEALPSYSMALNGLVRDEEGTSRTPWARWLRGWTAEENRHGDLLNAYLRLTGRVDMRAVERTVHHLIANGFNPETGADPYHLLIYTSFQERATRLSHSNVGRIAAREGDANLGRICGMIASDEARHEAFYTRMMLEVLEHDPVGGILAFRSMLRGRIAMPGRFHGRRQGSRSVRSLRDRRPAHQRLHRARLRLHHRTPRHGLGHRRPSGDGRRGPSARGTLPPSGAARAAGRAHPGRARETAAPGIQLDSRSKGVIRR